MKNREKIDRIIYHTVWEYRNSENSCKGCGVFKCTGQPHDEDCAYGELLQIIENASAQKHKTIRIDNYFFNLTFSSTTPNKILSSNFGLDAHHDRDITEKESKKGRALQHEIFDGIHDWRIKEVDWDEE